MYRKGQEVEVEIADLGEKDLCFGRLPDGMAVFVQGPVAIGDTARAEIFKVKKGYLVARFCGLVRPSPHRTEPPCPYFGTCGGCKWQHMDYAEQLRLKRKQVQDALRHLGGFEGAECEPCLPADPVYAYRNKMDFSFTDRRYLLPEEAGTEAGRHAKPLDFALGFHAPGCFSKAIDIDRCAIATDDTNLALETVRGFCLRHRAELPVYSTFSHTGELRNLVVRQAGRTGELMVNLVTTTHHAEPMRALRDELLSALGDRLATFVNGTTAAKNTVAFCEEEFALHGPGFITDRIGGYTFRISGNSFFQTNTAQAETLYEAVLAAAQPRPTDTLYDLFCGTGSIALFLSGHCQRVLGVELVESAVRDARENARFNGVANCEFAQLDLKHIRRIRQEMENVGDPGVVIADPPRAGLHPQVVAMLREIAPRAVVYVACNPASLARDGRALCEEGLYRLASCRPVDLFPQTNHVECVARFERQG